MYDKIDCFLISHKYLNHGKVVPTQKCFKNNMNCIKFYSTSSEVNSAKFYEDAFSMRKIIIKDNKNKSGIYKWTNKITNDIYIGQSIDLSKIFIKYFNLSYLKNSSITIWKFVLVKILVVVVNMVIFFVKKDRCKQVYSLVHLSFSFYLIKCVTLYSIV